MLGKAVVCCTGLHTGPIGKQGRERTLLAPGRIPRQPYTRGTKEWYKRAVAAYLTAPRVRQLGWHGTEWQ